VIKLSFIGAVGVVNQGYYAAPVSVPSNVSIATSSSGNHNNAFTSHVDNCGFTEGTFDGAFTTDTNSDSINDRVTVNVIVDGYASAFDGCDSAYHTQFGAYMRATGATSFAWQLSIVSQSLTGSSVALAGTITTDQNALFNSNGLVQTMQISFGGGRGGVTYPSAGDEIIIGLAATATNSAGDTAANSLSMLFNFIEN
tara:strand:+ start:4597 stop:5190 length:594 start_codon:yes stop_codon:yes gene_type:complete